MVHPIYQGEQFDKTMGPSYLLIMSTETMTTIVLFKYGKDIYVIPAIIFTVLLFGVLANTPNSKSVHEKHSNRERINNTLTNGSNWSLDTGQTSCIEAITTWNQQTVLFLKIIKVATKNLRLLNKLFHRISLHVMWFNTHSLKDVSNLWSPNCPKEHSKANCDWQSQNNQQQTLH